jgi:hypothetical protein
MEEDNFGKESKLNQDIHNNEFEKQMKENLQISLNEKDNNRLNTENCDMGSSREKDTEIKLNDLIENHSI